MSSYGSIPSKVLISLFSSCTAVTTSSSQGDVGKGRTLVHLSLDLSKKEKLDLDLSPDDFYKLCLELEKAKYQLEVLVKGTDHK